MRRKHAPKQGIMFITGRCYAFFDHPVEKGSKINQKNSAGIRAKKTAQGKEEGNLAPKNGNPTKIPILNF